MLKNLIGLCLMFVGMNSLLADNVPYFYSCEAKAGDGIIQMLHRYDLDEFDCNLEKFLQLNKLKKTDALQEGKKYQIPVLIYAYNGVSIRSTLSIRDMETALRIAKYNKLIQARNLRKSDYESSGVLWVPYHELNCPTPKSKPIAMEAKATKTVELKATKVSGAIHHEMAALFGPEYSHLDKVSEKLRGKVFYISSGHGGPDPGAITKLAGHMICEDEYAYDVSLRLARNLMENGAIVHIVIQDDNDGIRNEDLLTCDTDEKTMGSMVMPLNQLARLKQRTDAINDLFYHYRKSGIKEQTLICIHVDSRSENERQDVYFYHFANSTAGKKLACTMQKVFEEKYARYRPGAQFEGTVSCRNLYELRIPKPTTIYIELANIKNQFDRKRILPSTNRQALADWLCEGLLK
ncbi:MAG: N-acetylmuramoyl-L-alanine amidase [Saprospiraceae bacterium]